MLVGFVAAGVWACLVGVVSRAARRKRSFDFADVQLRGDFFSAIFGFRSLESARKPSGNAAAPARDVVAIHLTGDARARGHSDRDCRRGPGVDAPAKNAAGI